MTDHYDAMTQGLARCPICGGVPGVDCDCGDTNPGSDAGGED